MGLEVSGSRPLAPPGGKGGPDPGQVGAGGGSRRPSPPETPPWGPHKGPGRAGRSWAWPRCGRRGPSALRPRLRASLPSEWVRPPTPAIRHPDLRRPSRPPLVVALGPGGNTGRCRCLLGSGRAGRGRPTSRARLPGPLIVLGSPRPRLPPSGGDCPAARPLAPETPRPRSPGGLPGPRLAGGGAMPGERSGATPALAVEGRRVPARPRPVFLLPHPRAPPPTVASGLRPLLLTLL